MNFAKAFSPFKITISHPPSGLQVNAGFFNIVGTKLTNGEFYDPIKVTKNTYFNESTDQDKSMTIQKLNETTTLIKSDGQVPTSYSLFIEDFGNGKIEKKEITEPSIHKWEKFMNGVTEEEFIKKVNNYNDPKTNYSAHTRASTIDFLQGKFWQPLDLGMFMGFHTNFTKDIMNKSKKYSTVSLNSVANIEGGFSIKPNFDHSMFYNTTYRGLDIHKCRNGTDWMNISYSNIECGHHEFVAAYKLMQKEGVNFGQGYSPKNKDFFQELAYNIRMKIRQIEFNNSFKPISDV